MASGKKTNQNHKACKYTKAIGVKLCDKLGEGVSLKQACEDLKLNYSTVYGWSRDLDDFVELSAHAREAGRAAIGDQCLVIADDDEMDPADKRIRIDTRLRLLAKWDPKKWGDKTQLTGPDGTGPVEANVNVNFVDAPKQED